ncbi:DNA repair protein SWI5 homolog [Salminus brasiliensis]|uniref:DNA repair protein SWI5 homolog n=1 Tax=Salminus brasiliensis TaxID=930266 RepID=UPI003B82EF3E
MDSGTSQDVQAGSVEETPLKFTPQRGAAALASRQRTPYSGSKKVNSSFKSPVQASNTTSSAACIEEDIKDLQMKLAEMGSEIALLENEGIAVEELDQHIDLLHEYNDIKDIGQTLLGKLAGLRGVTTRDLYSQFDMDLDD